MITFRYATLDDSDLLFSWANDVFVRKNSFNSDPIIKTDHIIWLDDKLSDPNSNILIILKDSVPIGQVRVDIQENKGFISYSICSNYRGNNLGCECLNLIKNLFDINLVGYVKKDNIASIKAFEKSGYKKIVYDEFLEFIYPY